MPDVYSSVFLLRDSVAEVLWLASRGELQPKSRSFCLPVDWINDAYIPATFLVPLDHRREHKRLEGLVYCGAECLEVGSLLRKKALKTGFSSCLVESPLFIRHTRVVPPGYALARLVSLTE